MLKSVIPFVLAGLGFTLISLAIVMPLFEWQISEITTDLPPEFHINPSWTTTSGESLENDSYILNQVVLAENENNCSPRQLIYVVRRSQSDERLEQIALTANERITRWLTGSTLAGQSTMAVILFLCGMYIWWFTIGSNRPFSETIIATVLAALLLGFLINVWRIIGPEVGVFSCTPEIRGRLSFVAQLSKVHYETLLVLFLGITAEVGALGIIFRQIFKSANQEKESSKPAVG